MEFSNRRLLVMNEDLPISTSISPFSDTLSPSESATPSSSMLGRPFLNPIFDSNIAYAILILFTAVFFFGFILLYIRQISAAESFHRRREVPAGVITAAAAKHLPEISYRGDAKEVDCAICLEEFREGEKVKVIPYCKHVFHPECIDTWLVSHVTCPICRCSKLCGGGSTAEN